MNLPNELKYSQDHIWVRLQDDSTALLGITEFAQGELGDIVYVEVETENQQLTKGEVFGVVEAVKTVSDLFLPLDAKVLQFNKQLEDEPELINTSPYDKGWIVKIQINSLQELENLLTAQDYENFIGA